MEGRLFLDVVVAQCSAVLELLTWISHIVNVMNELGLIPIGGGDQVYLCIFMYMYTSAFSGRVYTLIYINFFMVPNEQMVVNIMKHNKNYILAI